MSEIGIVHSMSLVSARCVWKLFVVIVEAMSIVAPGDKMCQLTSNGMRDGDHSI